jgi:hypothetical protein
LTALALPVVARSSFKSSVDTPRACVSWCMSYVQILREQFAPTAQSDLHASIIEFETEQLQDSIRQLMFQFIADHSIQEQHDDTDVDDGDDDDDDQGTGGSTRGAESVALATEFCTLFPWHLVFETIIAWKLACVSSADHVLVLIDQELGEHRQDQQSDVMEFVSITDLVAEYLANQEMAARLQRRSSSINGGSIASAQFQRTSSSSTPKRLHPPPIDSDGTLATAERAVRPPKRALQHEQATVKRRYVLLCPHKPQRKHGRQSIDQH